MVDHKVAFTGGLDLCFGRWDMKQHPLADMHPDNLAQEVWPGQDFNNVSLPSPSSLSPY